MGSNFFNKILICAYVTLCKSYTEIYEFPSKLRSKFKNNKN